jgi:lipid-A-disaccharide synthase-like uncharacterized protein
MRDQVIFGIGLTAQLLFSARMIIQWIKSEVACKVLSPIAFWYLSLAGSLLLMIYGACREDIIIVFGQALMYYIYVRNLALKKVWHPLPFLIRTGLLLLPVLTLWWLSLESVFHISRLLQHEQIPSLLLIWGAIGQSVFLFRFISQWLISEKIKTSILPPSFWVLSLLGSLMLLTYAVFRHDPVIFLGQFFGAIIYIRNIIIYHRQTSPAVI